MPQIAASESLRSRLLDLPTELLLQILALVVVQPEPICLHPPPPPQGKHSSATVPPSSQRTVRLLQQLEQPPITRVNRLLREEGVKLFYSKNVFHGVNWNDPLPRSWIKKVDAEWRGHLRVVVSSGWEAKDVESHLRSAGIE